MHTETLHPTVTTASMPESMPASMPELMPPLFNDALPSPWGSAGHWLGLSDSAVIWYSECGSGPPLVLVHGWRGSSRFWKRNVPELARHFRVITFDLRGHGSSTKVLHGHTLPRYAQDMHELCTILGAERPLFAGWSMGGSICMEYWRMFGESAMRGIALLDSSLAPFADAPWNAFRLKEGKSDAHNASLKALMQDPAGFSRHFAGNMFGAAKATEAELDWMTEELTNTPPWIGAAIHTDYVVRNYERVLPSVSVPMAVFSGDFGPGNLEMGAHFAATCQNGRYYPYEHCGHVLFYEDAGRFNADMIAFGKER